MTSIVDLDHSEAELLLEASEGLSVTERRTAVALCCDAITLGPELTSAHLGMATREAAALLLELTLPAVERSTRMGLARTCERIVVHRAWRQRQAEASAVEAASA